jgi:hypothetical protein
VGVLPLPPRTASGVLIGPAALDWISLSAVGDQEVILEQASLVTLAVALVGVALRLPVGSSPTTGGL